jgi:hypothetical protein
VDECKSLVAGVFPPSWGVGKFLTEGAAKALSKIDNQGSGDAGAAAAGAGAAAGGLSLSAVWGWFITVVILWFAASCVEQVGALQLDPNLFAPGFSA